MRAKRRSQPQAAFVRFVLLVLTSQKRYVTQALRAAGRGRAQGRFYFYLTIKNRQRYISLRDTTHTSGLRSARGRGARVDKMRSLTRHSAFMMEILEVFRVVNCRLPAKKKIVDKLLVKNVKNVIYVKKKLYLCNVKQSHKQKQHSYEKTRIHHQGNGTYKSIRRQWYRQIREKKGARWKSSRFLQMARKS